MKKFIKYTLVYLRMSVTTIKLSRETKERIDKLREYKKESYEELLQKILDILNICKVAPIRAQKKLRRIQVRNQKAVRGCTRDGSDLRQLGLDLRRQRRVGPSHHIFWERASGV